MGSLLRPALANISMCSFENKWLKDCPHSLKPVFYGRYVDNIFILFSFFLPREFRNQILKLAFAIRNLFICIFYGSIHIWLYTL